MMGLLDNKLIKHACFRGGVRVRGINEVGEAGLSAYCVIFPVLFSFTVAP